MSAKRWSSYDEDAYRLPSGMTRVGYDADSGKYTFRDGSGQEYTSASGSAYGKLEKCTLLQPCSTQCPAPRSLTPFSQAPAGWDGGPLLPRTTRTGSASSASSAGLKSPATDFSEILSELEEEEEESEKDKPKEKARPLPFLILVSSSVWVRQLQFYQHGSTLLTRAANNQGSVMSFKSKLGSRRGRKEEASMWGKMKEKDYM